MDPYDLYADICNLCRNSSGNEEASYENQNENQTAITDETTVNAGQRRLQITAVQGQYLTAAVKRGEQRKAPNSQLRIKVGSSNLSERHSFPHRSLR